MVCLFVFFFLFSPVNFLGGLSNRYTIAATFGATASKCATLFLYTASDINMYQLGGPGWLNSKFMALDLRNFFQFVCLFTQQPLISVEDQFKVDWQTITWSRT